MNNIPLNEKYTLTIKEAASYFNIGVKKMRRLAEEHPYLNGKLKFCFQDISKLFNVIAGVLL